MKLFYGLILQFKDVLQLRFKLKRVNFEVKQQLSSCLSTPCFESVFDFRSILANRGCDKMKVMGLQ